MQRGVMHDAPIECAVRQWSWLDFFEILGCCVRGGYGQAGRTASEERGESRVGTSPVRCDSFSVRLVGRGAPGVHDWRAERCRNHGL